MKDCWTLQSIYKFLKGHYDFFSQKLWHSTRHPKLIHILHISTLLILNLEILDLSQLTHRDYLILLNRFENLSNYDF